jgi:hypothetical protein
VENDIIKTSILALVGLLDTGGSKPIILILLLVIGGLIWQLRRLMAQIERKDDKIEKIVDDYHKGNMTLTEALNQLKMCLWEIRARL